MTDRYPPGPDKTIFDAVRTTWRQRGDRLLFLMSLAQAYGDLVHFHTGLRHIYLLNDPALIHSVLVEHANKFNRTGPHKRAAGRFLGKGLLVIDGDLHRRERRLVQPALHRKRIETYAGEMVEQMQRIVGQWQSGQVYQIDREMMKITLNIVANTLFHTDVDRETEIVGEAMAILQEAIVRQFSSVIPVPGWIPTRRNRQEQRAFRALEQVIFRIIRERQTLGRNDQGDLLSILLESNDDGSQTDIQQVHDEVLSLLMAGHETTSNLLTWVWRLLAEHPDVTAKLHKELDSVLGGRPPTLQDLLRLPYTSMIVKEGLRLYPPAWLITREAAEMVTIGGYALPAGSVFVMSPFITHRHPRYFTEPEAFRPERFAGGREKDWPHFAYFPFGGGPHLCVGQSFALMEATLILATLAQEFRLELVPGQEISIEPLITLRPRHGIFMRVNRQRDSRINQDA